MLHRLRWFCAAVVFAACAACSASASASASVQPQVTHGDPRNAFPLPGQQHWKWGARSLTDPWTNPMPAGWCGEAVATVDLGHRTTPTTMPAYDVVYAHASDQPDRFMIAANHIQSELADAQSTLGNQDGADRILRIAMGTSCGPQFVQIIDLTLPHTLAEYQSLGTDMVRLLFSDMRNAWPSLGIPSQDNILLVADDVGNQTGYQGQGEWVDDDTPDPAQNRASRGGLIAGIYARNADPGGQEVILHEIFHNLGAVNTSAPNTSGYGHCSDVDDLMCYADHASMTLQQRCATSFDQPIIDCNRDDYYNPAPAPGSYLATHWDTYNSSFLCARAECLAPDTQPPGTPVAKLRHASYQRLVLQWAPRPLAEGVVRYLVYDRGRQVDIEEPKPGSGARVTFGPLRKGTKCLLQVVAVDEVGNRSSAGPLLRGRIPGYPARAQRRCQPA